MGAALAFYTLFSIAPLLLIVLSVAGLLFGEQAARGELFDQLADMVGSDSARTIQSMLQEASRPGQSVVGTLVGVLLMVFGATTVLAELQDAMDRIWRVPAQARGSGLISWLRVRLLSLGLVLGIGFLLMVSLLLSAALAAMNKWATPYFGEEWLLLASLLNMVIGFALIATLFAMLYKWLPRVAIGWRDVWLGAVMTALLFSVGKWAIGLYIGRSSLASGFGAAGSLVVLMVWVYFSAQIFLFGAEMTSVYAHRHGSLRGATPQAGARLAALDAGGETLMAASMRTATAHVPQPTPDVVPTPPDPRPPAAPDVVPSPEVEVPPIPDEGQPTKEPGRGQAHPQSA